MKRLLVLTLAIFGILAAGCIVRFGTHYEDTTGNTHVVALAQNLSAVDVVFSSVQVDFLDGSDRVIATTFTGPCTRTLQKGNSAPVEAVLPAGVEVDDFTTTIRPISFGQKAVADLDVEDVEVDVGDDTTHIRGTINIGNRDLFAIQACVAIFDEDDNVIRVGRAFASPADVDEDDSGTFDVALESSDDADQFQIWVDAITHNPSDVTAPVIVGPEDISAAIQNTGAQSPALSGDGTFTDPDNAFSNNDAYATVTLNAGGDPQSQVYTSYDLDDEVPDDVDITGIAVRVDWFVDATGNSPEIEVELSWDGGTTWTDARTDDDASTDEDNTITLGGSTDDWDHNWDVDELTNANFQVRITADATAAKTFSLDWIPVTVFYTED